MECWTKFPRPARSWSYQCLNMELAYGNVGDYNNYNRIDAPPIYEKKGAKPQGLDMVQSGRILR